ncbi:MAG: apolipoprotein N-acyltransferase [Gemmataceae bacterium]|nr:apolipoprotein N-acyltransferase [Gemmataceae bacterium]MCI0743470.1 apolipoprotein N-acyltransferase [Gemmataceae bacterium]
MKTATVMTPEPRIVASVGDPAFHGRIAPLVPAFFSGGLFYLCFFPISWGFLGWIALAPLLLLVRADTKPWKIYVSAYLGGSVFFWPILWWMSVADYRMFYTWAMLATYCALYFPVAVWLIRVLERRTGWPLTFTVPIVWTSLEFVRSFLLTGFAWYYLGHTQHEFLALIQIADLGGVYAISFILAAFNGWLVECALRFPAVRFAFRQIEKPTPAGRIVNPTHRATHIVTQGLIVAGLIVASLIYGAWRLDQETFRDGPRVALLQGSIDQRMRMEASLGGLQASSGIWSYYDTLCKLALNQERAPDLLIWPETSLPYYWLELPKDLDKVEAVTRREAGLVHGLLQKVAQDTKVSHLFGLNTKDWSDDGRLRQYNSAVLLNAQGKYLGRYDKIHRVPFGEYVPFRDWLPFMNRFAPYDFDYSIRAGESLTRLVLGDKYRLGVLICYEDTDPFLARQYGRSHADGPPVDFLVNISNDGWFDGTSEHEEHLAISRFRAIEARRPLVRAVNMGVSAVIDANGRVLRPIKRGEHQGFARWEAAPVGTPASMLRGIGDGSAAAGWQLSAGEWHQFKKTAGVITATVPLDQRTSLYAQWGDLLPGGCWLLLAGVIVWSKLRRKPAAA